MYVKNLECFYVLFNLAPIYSIKNTSFKKLHIYELRFHGKDMTNGQRGVGLQTCAQILEAELLNLVQFNLFSTSYTTYLNTKQVFRFNDLDTI